MNPIPPNKHFLLRTRISDQAIDIIAILSDPDLPLKPETTLSQTVQHAIGLARNINLLLYQFSPEPAPASSYQAQSGQLTLNLTDNRA